MPNQTQIPTPNLVVTDISDAQLLPALIGFCSTFATPKLADQMHVLDGFGNNRTLPPDGNDFCVVTPITQTRSGTDVVHLEKDGQDVIELREYVDVDIQIDCYSGPRDPQAAYQRAQTYETVARSYFGVDFFKRFGLDCLYADSLQNLSADLDSKQYVSRWMLMLHLGYWKRVQLDQDYFTEATVGVKNVDVTFKP